MTYFALLMVTFDYWPAVTRSRQSQSSQKAKPTCGLRGLYSTNGSFPAAEASTPDQSRSLAAWKLSGLSLQLAGRLPEAEEEFLNALKKFSADADLWFYLARVQYLQFEMKSGSQAARKAIELKHDHADAHTQLGMILEAQQEFTSALKAYERSIELNRRQRRPLTLPLLRIGQLLSKLNRLNEALEYLTSAVSLDQRSSEIRLARGRVLERLGRIAEAQKEYEQAVAIDGNPLARSHLDRVRSGGVTARDATSPNPNTVAGDENTRPNRSHSKADTVDRMLFRNDAGRPG